MLVFLVPLYKVDDKLTVNEGLYDLCDIATTYYSENRYPIENNQLPSFDEIKKVYEAAKELYKQVSHFVRK